MRKLVLFSLLSGFCVAGHAQKEIAELSELRKKNAETKNIDTTAWVYNGEFAIGLNQGLLHNWPAGGELASLTVNGLFHGSLIRYSDRRVWTNTLDMAHGLFYAYSNSFIPRKTDDRIDFTSKYGYRLKSNENFYLTGMFNAKTQFTKAYDYEVPYWDTFSTSKFLSPLYLTLAPGFEYRRGSQLSAFLSPFAGRVTFVDQYYTSRSPEGAFGVANGNNVRFELGAYFSGRYNKKVTENISFRTRLDLYSNYLAKNQVEDGVIVKRDNPGNIDILWDNSLSFKFFKYFSLNVGVLAIYDNDIPYEKSYIDEAGKQVSKGEPFSALGWWQIKQVMTAGFNYKF